MNPDISAYFLAGLSGGGASILLSEMEDKTLSIRAVLATSRRAHSHVGSSGLVSRDRSSEMICFKFFHVFFLFEARYENWRKFMSVSCGGTDLSRSDTIMILSTCWQHNVGQGIDGSQFCTLIFDETRGLDIALKTHTAVLW